jgi:hypothetical protein
LAHGRSEFSGFKIKGSLTIQQAFQNPKQFLFWKEALEASFFGQGKSYGREEFDKFLGDYDVHPAIRQPKLGTSLENS